ncbi:hypothetical protein GCM10007216_15370 [Thalassobacillus devorans]|uniref:Tetratricopeptide repeat protein n=1 Tax=Thalassobacillus devorans TaxID=279813 RepID=A0ABQ1NUQ2_9BACI|nr:tetratricopeptide repeat protein [Thalassobacillus devorans]NIK28520.1 tetratricopeptide (TPR) repeat protein [Thalassobacillus devorans]GGC85580.1 hypothetical protein GCM10007216_15370 [Thalassobacillus devorans]
MNIADRLNYLLETENFIQPDFHQAPFLQQEWEAILAGLLPLRRDQAIYLAELWKIPYAYLTDYNKTDIDIHRKLQSLQHDMLTNNKQAEVTLSDLSAPYAIPSLMQEVIFKLLQAVHFYKKNKLDNIEKLESEYFSYMLPNNRIMKESGVFQKALFYYYGFKYYYEGKREESFAYFERLLEMTGDKEEVISLIQNLTLIANENKEYDRAVDFAKRMEEFSLTNKVNRGLAIARNYLGVLYLLKENYPAAIYYFEKMEHLDLTPLMRSRMYHNLGLLYSKQERRGEAIEMFLESKDIKESNQLKEDLFLAYHSLARNYFLAKQQDDANHYLKLAYQTAGNEDEESLAKKAEAEMRKESDPKTAIELYEQALKYYEKVQFMSELDELYPVLAELYKKIGNRDMEILYKKRHQALHKSQKEAKHA